VEATAQKLLEAVHSSPSPLLVKARPRDIHNLIKFLKLREVCVIGSIPNEYLRHLTRRPLFHLTLI
jgi:hypothetical protein